MALKDILTNGKYADDMVLSLPDGTTATVGEMRGMEAAERNALLKRQRDLESAEQGLLQRTNSLRQAGLLDEQLNPITTREIKQQITASTGLDESDPLFGPMVKETKAEIARLQAEHKAELDAIKAQVGKIAGATQQAVQGYLGDFYDATFTRSLSTLPEPVRKDVKLEDAIKFATDRKLLDASGRLDIASAVDRMSWDRVKDYERSQIAKESQQLTEEKKSLAQMSRPGLNGPRVTKPSKEGFSPVDEKGRTKSFEEALAAAQDDDQIWTESAQQFLGRVQ